jgi:hypothetical protein
MIAFSGTTLSTRVKPKKIVITSSDLVGFMKHSRQSMKTPLSKNKKPPIGDSIGGFTTD